MPICGQKPDWIGAESNPEPLKMPFNEKVININRLDKGFFLLSCCCKNCNS